MGRIFAQELSDITKQRFVVENRVGAAGLIGAQFVSDAKPDGYTLVYTSGITMSTAPSMLKNSTFDLVRDLTPIAQTVVGPEVFAINPKIPAKNFKEFVEYLKAHPGFKWSIGGVGSLEQLTIAALDKMIGTKSLIVPYNGVGPGVVAAMSGEVDGALAPLPAMKAALASGDLRGLAVTSADPIPQLPNIPTIASVGYPNLVSYNWNGIWGPKNLPKELVRFLHDKIVEATKSSTLKDRVTAGGFFVPAKAMGVDEFTAYVKAEVDKYDPILEELKLKHIQ
jgi:tripartite-type tricarboxylate transporter receptor subunit TctC